MTDDGRGIDPNLLPHILEGDFKRSVGSSEDKKRNMGIGLSVCSTIISAHEGKCGPIMGRTAGLYLNSRFRWTWRKWNCMTMTSNRRTNEQ